jgi:ATP-dependent DNA helicase RecG
LNINKFKNLAAERLPEITRINSVESLLSKLRLTYKGAFSNAAVLLFANDPQQFFIQAQTKIGRFDNNGNLLGTNLIEGNLFTQLQQMT